MESDITEFKREQLERRRRERDERSPSILDTFEGVHLGESQEIPVAESSFSEISLNDRPNACPVCKGIGYTKTLFSRWECINCFGTGYDLSDPVAVIKWQKLCLDWSKKKIHQYKSDLLHAKTTPEERMAKGVSDFYESAKRKD